MTNADLNTLLTLCNTSSQACANLERPILLPPALQCNVGKVCASCNEVGATYQQYLKKYGQDYAAKVNSLKTFDTIQEKKNTLFANYMNIHLGFHYEDYDYLEFMAKCNAAYVGDNPTDTIASSLQTILSNYQNNIYNAYTPHLDSGNCDVTHWMLNNNAGGLPYADPQFRLSNWMRDSILQMPATDINKSINSQSGWSTNYVYADTLCLNNKLDFETRVKFATDSNHLKKYITTPGIYNPGMFNDSCEAKGVYGSYFEQFRFDNNVAVDIWLERGGYLDDAHLDSVYLNVEVYNGAAKMYTHDHIYTGLRDLSAWHTLRTKINNGIISVYLDGTQITTGHTYPGSFTKFYGMSLNPVGLDAQLDWVKMYDSSNATRYIEDFTGCSSMGKQTFPRNCNCQQSFADHYNSVKGTQYTFAQIDTIYFNTLGIHPQPCNTTGGNGNCDSLSATLTGFNTFYKAIDFTQTHTDTDLYNHDCKISFATFFNRKHHTNYSYKQIKTLYHLCNNFINDPCAAADDAGPTLCGKAEPVFAPIAFDINAINSCSDSTDFSVMTGTDKFNAYTDSLNNVFDSMYRHKCLEAYKYETFTVKHAVSEYHHTLYYYDQAGNLSKTIPPLGVEVRRRQSWYDSVAIAR
ncbi:MAG: hypothetical protein HY305_06670, partial [Sphingobacteriales bacterium]|nr:hypothetical protein [Sphingobacteriales bacterium]